MSILPLYLRQSQALLNSANEPLSRSRRQSRLPRGARVPVAIAYLLLAGVFGLSALLAHVQSA